MQLALMTAMIAQSHSTMQSPLTVTDNITLQQSIDNIAQYFQQHFKQMKTN